MTISISILLAAKFEQKVEQHYDRHSTESQQSHYGGSDSPGFIESKTLCSSISLSLTSA